MALERRILVVVQPGATQAFVIQFETQRLDQVQLAAGVGAQADDVAGIGWDFGLEQDDVEHGRARGGNECAF